MKKQITLAATLLLMVIGFSSCQKEEQTSLKKDIIGTWKVAKIETTVQGSATETYTGVASDTFEFRNNEQDEVIVNLKSQSFIGTYVVMEGKALNLSYGGKLYTTTVTTVTGNKLEFSGSVDKSSIKFYLTR
ncbi:lipocalin family protein [Pedobacter africanus]|jgi:hypothetical protein|uniref:Uncharacterized protein (DUF2147 family) n=2 Tax=Pedobacter africanus TaxID=151894 RepID=A0ACC6KZ65_9SPHI|nr:lipocalin family protein [Pedobacter africanus]MDR6784432.1 uncharacterized protein (DUF2147 family) [Pedobacter africanus]SMC57529.1 hypothetical protein SAMN04488524_1280 [Pedobacter africanus]